ncbi:MAG TPA: hypothetical protein VIQ81_03810 [Gammaproteobacteria bacterium]
MMPGFSKKVSLIKIFMLVLLSAGCFSLAMASESDSGVLVAAQDSPVQKVDILEIRRIYIGLESSAGSGINQPVMNLSDPFLYKTFLKNVMHMTESGYRRKTVKRIFRQGGERVKQIESHAELIEYLKNNKNDVSFMDFKTAQQIREIKVIQILW